MSQKHIQLFVPIAIAITFLSAVADRFGFYGKPIPEGQYAAWGVWENFVIYSTQLNFFLCLSTCPSIFGYNGYDFGNCFCFFTFVGI